LRRHVQRGRRNLVSERHGMQRERMVCGVVFLLCCRELTTPRRKGRGGREIYRKEAAQAHRGGEAKNWSLGASTRAEKNSCKKGEDGSRQNRKKI